ncbi:hypothetical protein FHT40_000722 [Mycolicibacterium sp. BK556]|nr:hypothetical protein [Mycolicibacterium sp. BK634]MBB3601089.1 hypothetical protein [Mycolicibacterium sp. BK556]MBB3630843.1 hypothetical protein [Mycolicibacterium sp. BK607]MBB3748839.1 hypothetical protein [Mycolicibacterium sp. BK634]
MYSERRTHFQLICWEKLGGFDGGGPAGPPLRGGGGGGSFGGGVPSKAALTTSIGSRSGTVSSRIGWMIDVNRSSGGTWRLGAVRAGPGESAAPATGILVVGDSC